MRVFLIVTWCWLVGLAIGPTRTVVANTLVTFGLRE